jgi:hypothetical protein
MKMESKVRFVGNVIGLRAPYTSESQSMSYRWYFHVYSHEAFEAMFRGGREDLTETFIEMSTWDDYGDVVSRMTAMSERVAARGICYEGLSEAQARDLDEWIHFAFCPEGLEEELEVGFSLGDGLTYGLVCQILEMSRIKLHRRAPGSDKMYSSFDPGMVGLLEGGRRYGQSGPSKCEYLFLSPEEVAAMVRDAVFTIEHVEPCDATIALREEVVDVLSSVPAGTYVYGRLS